MMSKIVAYLHCKKCLEELPSGQSPADFQSIEVGWTRRGIQVWCKRHDYNVLHIDFEGQKHPGDFSATGAFEKGGAS